MNREELGAGFHSLCFEHEEMIIDRAIMRTNFELRWDAKVKGETE